MKKHILVNVCICLMILISLAVLAVAAPTAPDYEKILQIHLNYKNDEYKVISQTVTYGRPPNLAILFGPIKGNITDKKGSQLASFYLTDPGIAVGEIVANGSTGSLIPYSERQLSGTLTLNLPVFTDMQIFSLYDTRSGTLLVSSDVSSAFSTFCLGYPKDPDCLNRGTVASQTSTLPDNLLIIVGVFAGVIIAAEGILYLTKRAKMSGPEPVAKQAGIVVDDLLVTKQTVLIVDDSLDIIDVVSSALIKNGYQCITATGGKECLDILMVQKPDVILLDVMMEPLDGWSTLRQIKKNLATKSIPVLMLTANNLTAHDAQKYHICIEDYIQKPFHEEALFAAIEQILARKNAIRASLAMAEKAGVDREKFCKLASLSTRVLVDKKIINILQKPEDGMFMACTVERETKEVISEMIRNLRVREIQMEELKNEITRTFTRNGFVPPSW
ncbi:response regulator [Methanoregula sp.]|uniref:response regulator n=1 Tax=Methanoregula sp. TaxID=2052170 RepID=UPI003BB08F25